MAQAQPVGEEARAEYLRRIEQKCYADMEYMYRNVDKRLDPRLLMPGVKTIVSVALSYVPARRIPDDQYQIAAYAYGKDYHEVMKAKLHQLAARLRRYADFNYRAFCDTAPVMERYWAQQAGIGWRGHNDQFIVAGHGSMCFLGELFLDIELDPSFRNAVHSPLLREGGDRGGSELRTGGESTRCGNCHKCIDACPTGAITRENIGTNHPHFNASRCLSYLTIERREALPDDVKSLLGTSIYGCDRCLNACPHNQRQPPCTTAELQPSEALLGMTRAQWQQLTPDDYRQLFRHSAMKRAKYEGLRRNIEAVAGNERFPNP